MSEFRIEKQRAEAEVTLSGGGSLRGAFFLAGSSSNHLGPERVADLLNAEKGFFPFETNANEADTILINRAHVVSVKLLERTNEPQLDPGYDLATERRVSMLLSNGMTLCGAVASTGRRGATGSATTRDHPRFSATWKVQTGPLWSTALTSWI
jgi:hypothetical protein